MFLKLSCMHPYSCQRLCIQIHAMLNLASICLMYRVGKNQITTKFSSFPCVYGEKKNWRTLEEKKITNVFRKWLFRILLGFQITLIQLKLGLILPCIDKLYVQHRSNFTNKFDRTPRLKNQVTSTQDVSVKCRKVLLVSAAALKMREKEKERERLRETSDG